MAKPISGLIVLKKKKESRFDNYPLLSGLVSNIHKHISSSYNCIKRVQLVLVLSKKLKETENIKVRIFNLETWRLATNNLTENAVVLKIR